MKKRKLKEEDTIHVASSGDMTGFVPTPPLTGDEEEAYESLGSFPAQRKTARKIAPDPCGGGRDN